MKDQEFSSGQGEYSSYGREYSSPGQEYSLPGREYFPMGQELTAKPPEQDRAEREHSRESASTGPQSRPAPKGIRRYAFQPAMLTAAAVVTVSIAAPSLGLDFGASLVHPAPEPTPTAAMTVVMPTPDPTPEATPEPTLEGLSVYVPQEERIYPAEIIVNGNRLIVSLDALELQSTYPVDRPETKDGYPAHRWTVYFTDQVHTYEVSTAHWTGYGATERTMTLDEMQSNLWISGRSISDLTPHVEGSTIYWSVLIPEEYNFNPQGVEIIRSEVYEYEPIPEYHAEITSSGDVLTVSLDALELYDAYPVHRPGTEANVREYSWSVTFTDGNNTYEVSTATWNFTDGVESIKTLDEMQSSLWFRGEDYWDSISHVDLRVDGTTLYWSFTIPEGYDFNLQDAEILNSGFYAYAPTPEYDWSKHVRYEDDAEYASSLESIFGKFSPSQVTDYYREDYDNGSYLEFYVSEYDGYPAINIVEWFGRDTSSVISVGSTGESRRDGGGGGTSTATIWSAPDIRTGTCLMLKLSFTDLETGKPLNVPTVPIGLVTVDGQLKIVVDP